MSPEEFLRKHEEFIARFTAADGSVTPLPAETQAPAAHAMPKMPAGDHASHDMSGADMSGMSMGEASSQHGSDAHTASESDQSAYGSTEPDPAHAPIDAYLLAYRFGFEPGEFRLQAGQAYRFRMMASDIAHGASLSFGGGSRIIRLRPNVVSEQTITFQRPGPVLVYCTVYCGPAHDMMKARILVA